MADSLELEESELFDQEGVDYGSKAAPEEETSTPAAVFAEGGASDASDEEDDDAVGLDLELDGDTSDSERLAHQLASLQSSMEHSDPMEAAVIRDAELGTSEGPPSRVGSLKRFDSLGRPQRGCRSEGDLWVAASVPAMATPIAAAMRQEAVNLEREEDSYSHLGTSMPIRIPPMHRRGLAASPGAQEGRSTAFVPPHLLDLHADATADGGALASFKDSPSQAVKREKLMKRNAVLRSTGFIEVQTAFAGPSEVMDAVKESLIAGSGAAAARAPAFQRRPTAPSSLTALLSSSH